MRASPVLRVAATEDLPVLADIFREAAQRTGPERYGPAQVASWAAFPGETDAFQAFILGAYTLVAEAEGSVVAFGGLRDDGYLASLYTHPDHNRKGVGTLLLRSLLDRAWALGLPRIHTAASEFSRPLFEKHGFTLDEVEVVDRRGATFRRYLMSLAREAAPGV